MKNETLNEGGHKEMAALIFSKLKAYIEGFLIKTMDNNLGSAWSSTASYVAGQYVIYQNYIYRCIKNVTAGTAPTNATYWEKTNLASEITALNSNLTTSISPEVKYDTGAFTIIKYGNICVVRTTKCFTNSSTTIEYTIPAGFYAPDNLGRQIIPIVRNSDGLSCGSVWIYKDKFDIYKDSTSQFNIIGAYICA